MRLRVTLAESLKEGIRGSVNDAISQRVVSALAAGDPSLWGADAVSEASVRLGWTHNPESAAGLLALEVGRIRDELRSRGLDRVILCGMGGSSLAPEVMAKAENAPLTILDTTFPDAIARVTSADLVDTVTVVSSKSGGTVETDSQRLAMEAAYRSQGIDPRERIIVVTDPDTPLHALAREAGYRVVLGNPAIGGRFSAFSAFGLLPAGIAGVNVDTLVRDAAAAWREVVRDDPTNPALILGTAIAYRHPEVNKVLIRDTPHLPGFGDWVEQLVAESTGKDQRGVLPVIGSSHDPTADCVTIGQPGSDSDIEIDGSLGELMVLWQFATAFACRIIGVNPFDQPNVESAKRAARSLLDGPASGQPDQEEKVPGGSVWAEGVAEATIVDLAGALRLAASRLGPRGYTAVCVFGDPAHYERYQEIRRAIEAYTRRPATLGFGPRFLHSTGQYHKGGPTEGVFLQVIETPLQKHVIPQRPFDFAQLLTAQAHGDRQVLAQAGLPVVSITLEQGGDVALARALDQL